MPSGLVPNVIQAYFLLYEAFGFHECFYCMVYSVEVIANAHKLCFEHTWKSMRVF